MRRLYSCRYDNSISALPEGSEKGTGFGSRRTGATSMLALGTNAKIKKFSSNKTRAGLYDQA
jgi:hypothetical protein